MRRPLLLPLVPLYAAGLALREMRLERGWEKVPAAALAGDQHWQSIDGRLGKDAARNLAGSVADGEGLSRGCAVARLWRRTSTPLRVDPNGSADEFGDEPLLIAREASVPVYVAAERYEAGQLAEAELSNLSTASPIPDREPTRGTSGLHVGSVNRARLQSCRNGTK